MTLHLDARQRAMLQEMGVTVWAPAPASAPASPPAAPVARPAASAMPAPAPAAGQRAQVAGAGPTATPQPSVARSQQAPATTPSPGNAIASDAAAPALRLHPPLPLYPLADPAQTPSALGSGWLLVAESTAPQTPLEGDAGRLLDNMLRAMQLHQHPRVFLAALERAAPGSQPAGPEVAAALAQAVAQLRPAMVLVLGHVAARAALGRPEPLGRLRAEVHQLAGCPAVVTYDPAFLLRSQDNKAAAWADLCRALALVRAQERPSA